MERYSENSKREFWISYSLKSNDQNDYGEKIKDKFKDKDKDKGKGN
jgi:hypothetical protein